MATKSDRQEARLWLVPGSGSTPPPSPSRAFDDSELLAAIRQGDPGAANALYDRLRPQVERTLRRLLGVRDPDFADVAQQTMIQIVSTVDRYRGDCALDSWTSAVAAHMVYKHIRRRKLERRIFGALDADLLAETRSPSRTGRDAILRNLMRRVLVHLDGIEQTKAWAFVLHDVCGYHLREIAEITGVSAAAAQTRLIRGRREVHERIASDPELVGLLESIEGHS
ncbi:MAG TPA: sigma-70 family RNA polymerase sigma factor [Polyangiaceae bacterium]|jgi:RNA polymerase sigma-70 factor (ECF subfamily)|nr:sigma-70 family RNA polymerase sigma factor [Polyangiaceae bacterium]